MITAKEARDLMIEKTLSKANDNPQFKDWFTFVDTLVHSMVQHNVQKVRRELPIKKGYESEAFANALAFTHVLRQPPFCYGVGIGCLGDDYWIELEF
jgi:hypothetical protein